MQDCLTLQTATLHSIVTERTQHSILPASVKADAFNLNTFTIARPSEGMHAAMGNNLNYLNGTNALTRTMKVADGNGRQMSNATRQQQVYSGLSSLAHG
jgi:hypothetical protein